MGGGLLAAGEAFKGAKTAVTVVYLTVVVIALAWFVPIARPVADDPALISNAIHGIAMTPDWSPLYRLFISGIYAVFGQAAVYPVIYGCAVVIVAVTFYFAILMNNKSIFVAVTCSLLVLFSPASILLETWGRIPSSIAVYYGMALFLAALFMIKKINMNGKSAGAVLVPLILASLCRPEFLFSSIAFVLVFFVFGNWRGIMGRWVGRAGVLLGALCFGAGCFYVFGVPIAPADRAVVAFGQHVALRFCMDNIVYCKNINPWPQWEEITALIYPIHDRLLPMILSNPEAFVSHAMLNFVECVVMLITAGYASPVFFDPSLTAKVAYALVSLPVATALVMGLRGIRTRMSWREIAFVALSCAPFLAAQILFFPRLHYAAPPIYCLLFLVGWGNLGRDPAGGSSQASRETADAVSTPLAAAIVSD